MKRLISLLFLALALVARAQGPDEQYVRIYQMIQEADRLNETGESRLSAAKYVEAREALTRFRAVFPGWNERVINYRLNYVGTKLAPLTSMLAGTAPVATNNVPGTTPAAPVTSPGTPQTTPAVPPPTAPAITMSAEVENQIRALQAEVEKLQADNQKLNAKLKEALSVQPAAMDPRELAKAEERIRELLKENDLVKAQLAQRGNMPATAAPANDVSAKLAEQTEAIAALRTENEVLKKQSAEWRAKHDALAMSASAGNQAPAASADPQLVAQLRAENTALQKQVELLRVAQRPAAGPTMPPEAQRELAALRARVDVLEAKPVPYTLEELALFAKSPALLNANVATTVAAVPATAANVAPPAEGPTRKVSRGVPTGAGALVRAAERAFASGDYTEAEQKYLELLRQDENNVTTLGNLASAQLELGRVAEAEKNITRALEMDPDDHFNLYVLGRLRFRQEKLDEALNALSRSAKTNPEFADVQNYLGIVLSEKGLRGPAETALRKAIQLQPENPVAHNNLAVVYATQTPPALALARWHYQKAIAGGHPKNPELEKLLQN